MKISDFNGNAYQRKLFVLRRACLLGNVSRAQVMQAFNVTGDTARKDLMAAAEQWPNYLTYTPSQGVRVQPFAAPPEEASSTAFLSLMQSGAPSYALGLTRYEPVSYNPAPRFVYQGPEDRQMVMTLFKACLARTPIDIEYVGLRLGETRKTRTVLPLGLELLGQQWRMVAHDVDTQKKQMGAEQKVFVLARILNVRVNLPLHGKWLKSPRGERLDLQLLQVERPERDYQVTLNRQFTPDQIEAMAREFALTLKGNVYVIRMPERNLVEFKRDYCAHAAASDDDNDLKEYALPVFESIRPYAAR